MWRARLVLLLLSVGAASAASAASAAELRAENANGLNAVRVTWDGRGELVAEVSHEGVPRTLARAVRAGRGVSWLPAGIDPQALDGWTSIRLEQRVASRVVAEGPWPSGATAPILLWSPQSKPGDTPPRAADCGWRRPQAFSGSATVALAKQPDDLPPRADCLDHLRLVILDGPGLADRRAESQALLTYTADGGTLLLTDTADLRLPAIGPAERLPGEPRLTRATCGAGWVLRSARLDRDNPRFWQRLAMATPTRASLGAELKSPLPLDDMARALDPIRPMPAGPLAAFAAAYLLTVALLLALARRRLRRGLWLWLLSPALAAGFVGLALAMDAQRSPTLDGLCCTAFASVASDSPRARVSAAVRLRSGSYGTYALAAQPNSDSWAPERNQLPVRIGPDNQVATWPWVVPARSARTVTGTWHQALRGVVRLRLDGDDFSIHGTITNELPVALRRPVLLWAHGGWALDNIAAGATLQVRAASAPADLQLDLLWREVSQASRPAVPPTPPPAAPPPPSGGPRKEPMVVTLYAWVDEPWYQPELDPPVPLRAQRSLLGVTRLLGRADGAVQALTLSGLGTTMAAVSSETEGWASSEYAMPSYAASLRATVRLTKRWPGLHAWDPRRQEFVPVDGAADLTPLLDHRSVHLALRGARQKSEPGQPATYKVDQWPELSVQVDTKTPGRRIDGRQ